MSHEQRIKHEGISLPVVAEPRGAYVPAVVAGNLCHTAAQLAFVDGEVLHRGQVGADVTVGAAQEAAAVATLNAIAAIRREIGSLDRVARVVRLAGYVSTAPGFTDAHVVTNGASDLLERVFGAAGRHARVSIGVASLPLGASVAVELTVMIGE